MSAFEEERYRDVISSYLLLRKKQFGGRYTYEKMATACGVQKTYLSKVMHEGGDLNADQLYSALEYLKLTQDEIDFTLLLRERELTQNSNRKAKLQEGISLIQKNLLKTVNKLDSKNLTAENDFLWEYYADIDRQLTHLFLTIPRFSQDPFLICECIGVDRRKLEADLLKLQEWRLVTYKNGKYIAAEPKLHLPEDSPAFTAFQILNRVKSIEKFRKAEAGATDDYNFSVFFSADSAFKNRFRKRLLALIKETQDLVIDSKAQEVYQFNIDFLHWS